MPLLTSRWLQMSRPPCMGIGQWWCDRLATLLKRYRPQVVAGKSIVCGLLCFSKRVLTAVIARTWLSTKIMFFSCVIVAMGRDKEFEWLRCEGSLYANPECCNTDQLSADHAVLDVCGSAATSDVDSRLVGARRLALCLNRRDYQADNASTSRHNCKEY